jgi:anti-sigma regulatory factor (Ser/Thr protein kinase)
VVVMLLDCEAPLTTLEHGHLVVEADARRWALDAADAKDAARKRRAFREYLEQYGDPASEFDAAEAVYGELVANCILHAPAEIRIEFRWHDRTLVVVDCADRLRAWPFSFDDMRAETTHHAYALISAFTDRIHLTRDAGGGTRASVVLPVSRARHVPVIRGGG